MTERLRRAVEQAGAVLLPEEQDQLAISIIALLDADDEAKWDTAFTESGDKLDQLADNAQAEIREDRATPLDPGKL